MIHRLLSTYNPEVAKELPVGAGHFYGAYRNGWQRTAIKDPLKGPAQSTRSLSPNCRSDALVIFGGPIGSNVDLLVAPKDGGAARSMPIQLKELLP
jgi:hypothetical protein